MVDDVPAEKVLRAEVRLPGLARRLRWTVAHLIYVAFEKDWTVEFDVRDLVLVTEEGRVVYAERGYAGVAVWHAKESIEKELREMSLAAFCAGRGINMSELGE